MLLTYFCQNFNSTLKKIYALFVIQNANKYLIVNVGLRVMEWVKSFIRDDSAEGGVEKTTISCLLFNTHHTIIIKAEILFSINCILNIYYF